MAFETSLHLFAHWGSFPDKKQHECFVIVGSTVICEMDIDLGINPQLEVIGLTKNKKKNSTNNSRLRENQMIGMLSGDDGCGKSTVIEFLQLVDKTMGKT